MTDVECAAGRDRETLPFWDEPCWNGSRHWIQVGQHLVPLCCRHYNSISRMWAVFMELNG